MFFPFFGVSLWLSSRSLFYFFFIFLVYLSGYTYNVGYLNKCVCNDGVLDVGPMLCWLGFLRLSMCCYLCLRVLVS